MKKEINWFYNIGDTIVDNRDIIITNQKIISKNTLNKRSGNYTIINLKYYTYNCNNCGFYSENYSKWVWENDLKHGAGCCACAKYKKFIVQGINDIATTHPNILPLLNDINDGYKHSAFSNKKLSFKCPKCSEVIKIEPYHIIGNIRGLNCLNCHSLRLNRPDLLKYLVNPKKDGKISCASEKKILCKCPDCSFTKETTVSNLFYNGLSCSRCSDNLSYPTKFLVSILEQLGVHFGQEVVTMHNKRYDFVVYLDTNYIIEVNGEQHYCNGFESYGGKTIIEEQENDLLKMSIAIDLKLINNIEQYIVLDCRKSTLEWLETQIRNNKRFINMLSQHNLDINNVNFNKANEFATKSMIKVVSSYWNEHIEQKITAKDVATKFGFCHSTAIKYLKKGNELGWCHYNVKDEYNRGIYKKGKNAKELEVYTLDGIFIGKFNSAQELLRNPQLLNLSSISSQGISKVCNGQRKQYKGYIFRYSI